MWTYTHVTPTQFDVSKPFDELFNDVTSLVTGNVKKSLSGSTHVASSMRTNDGSYIIDVPLPGVVRERLTVTTTQGVLAIVVSKADDQFVKHLDVKYAIPDDVVVDDATAKFVNGLLSVVFPARQHKVNTLDIK